MSRLLDMEDDLHALLETCAGIDQVCRHAGGELPAAEASLDGIRSAVSVARALSARVMATWESAASLAFAARRQ